MRLADTLGDSVSFYKLGLELCMSGGYFELLDWMVARGKKVFVDLKFFDVPATVAAAVGTTGASPTPRAPYSPCQNGIRAGAPGADHQGMTSMRPVAHRRDSVVVTGCIQ